MTAEWQKTLQIRREVTCHAFVVMPNHFHGLVSLHGSDAGDRAENRPSRFGDRTPRSLPAMVSGFKSAVSRAARRDDWPAEDDIWQRGFHEHVVRSQQSFDNIYSYIRDNPARWLEDRFNS